MGKENKRGELIDGSEEVSTGIGRRVRRKEVLRADESKRGQRQEDEERRKEKEDERAIEEMLTECYQRAVECGRTHSDYDLGGEFGSQNEHPSPPGQGGEAEAASQSEVRSKQSAGMGRGQRRAWIEEQPNESAGEVARSSHFAWNPLPRLALTPCRGEPFLTEQMAPTSWQKNLRSACGKKESSLRELSPALSQSLEVLSKTTRCGQSTEGIFPLPLPGTLGWVEPVDSVVDWKLLFDG